MVYYDDFLDITEDIVTTLQDQCEELGIPEENIAFMTEHYAPSINVVVMPSRPRDSFENSHFLQELTVEIYLNLAGSLDNKNDFLSIIEKAYIIYGILKDKYIFESMQPSVAVDDKGNILTDISTITLTFMAYLKIC